MPLKCDIIDFLKQIIVQILLHDIAQISLRYTVFM